ncbi:two-component system regulatory protein YycI [Listeria costaricensis]|uniref:two-component system regulatory protein YycI n=1 Tax=Listeria costaricensis TaxID=2026604 RepID=UPI000C07D5D4|nr:two-component system regulatory protein YycI [Listeria costaricensis]
MDWKKTEIIFIIAFLILDIFLAFMFFNKQLTDDPDKLGTDTLQDHLKTDNISYPPSALSTKKSQGAIFTAEQTAFVPKDLPNDDNQSFLIEENGSTIYATLKKPVKANKQGDSKEMAAFMKSNVYKGDSYKFWRYDKDSNQLIYNQVMKDEPVLMDKGGQITFQMNQQYEIVSYQQTILGKQDDLEDKAELISSMDALEAIYQHGDLKTDSEIKKVDFGYYTTVQLSSGDVYFPVWCFEIEHKGETNYILVNAKDEQVINMNENHPTTTK